jgi:methionyl aminopeptidase
MDGAHLRDVSCAIEAVLVKSKVGIVRELSGHGVGFQLHEEPTLYNYDTGRLGPMLQNGLVIAIEPMATLGSTEILLASDDWTYRTADGSLAAHYEHTVALWDSCAFVLTDQDDDNARQAFGAVA